MDIVHSTENLKAIELFKDIIFEIPLNENLKEYLKYSKKLKKQKGRKISNVGGFQSDELDLKEKILQSLIKNIEYYANIFCNDILKVNKKITLTSMWLNINYYKDYNISHVHSFSMLSGVFYIKTLKNSGNLIFKRNHALEYCIKDKPVEYNSYNATTFTIPSKENNLYIFPSWYEHYVEPNLSKEERVSISFNLL
jgi:uncharacterized protein (TIGR02466 family)